MYKECSFANIKTFEESQTNFLPALSDYYAHPEAYRLEPFCIFGNLYYVGDKKVCCHLIDTGDGLILFDTGYGHDTPFLLENPGKNPFINPEAWHIFLSALEARCIEFEALGY